MWPDIQNPSTLQETKIKGQLRSDFENGSVQSAAKWTRSRKKFELSWDSMSKTDKSTLETFFDNNLGGTFTWTNPADNQEYIVRFAEDEINMSPKLGNINYWKVDLELEEA